MKKLNKQIKEIPEDEIPFTYIGSFEILDADKVLGEFEKNHIRCCADFPTEFGGRNYITTRATARIKIYVHPDFFKEAEQICKKLGISPW